MATHSSVLAWRIPGMGSLVGCHLWGRTESDTTKATQQQQQQQASNFIFSNLLVYFRASQVALVVKNSPANAGY